MTKRTLRNRIIIFATLAVAIAFACIGWIKMDGVYSRFSNFKAAINREEEYDVMHEELVDISDLEVLDDNTDAWYMQYHFVSHSGGGIDGKLFTDCLEAWELSYANGNRVFDADLSFTSDGVLVLRHSWNDNMEQTDDLMMDSMAITDRNGVIQRQITKNILSYDDFSGMKIMNKYTSMSCDDMIEYMLNHEDLFVSCDMKDDPAESYQYLIDRIIDKGAEDILDRIIVNVYDYDEYKKIMDVYDFKNVTARQYYVSPNNYYELIEFCVENDIHVVNVSSCYAEDEGVQLLHSYGIHTIVAVVDYISDMQYYYELGFDGAVTNYLYEGDWNLIEIVDP